MSTDLTSALVTLTRAAESRRTSRKQLREASATVARAIAEHLRSGDTITLDSGVSYALTRVTWRGRQGEGWPAEESDPAPVLLRGAVALWDPREDWHDGRNLLHAFGGLLDPHAAAVDYRIADAATHQAFADEAGEVLVAFAALHDREAAAFADAAHTLTKQVPR